MEDNDLPELCCGFDMRERRREIVGEGRFIYIYSAADYSRRKSTMITLLIVCNPGFQIIQPSTDYPRTITMLFSLFSMWSLDLQSACSASKDPSTGEHIDSLPTAYAPDPQSGHLERSCL